MTVLLAYGNCEKTPNTEISCEDRDILAFAGFVSFIGNNILDSPRLERYVEAEGSLFEQLLDALIPDGLGYVAALEAYFDESARDVGVFSVAGYLFEPGSAREYAREAVEVFGRYGGLHMKNLVHRQKGYKGISDETRDDLVRSAVDMVNRHITAGVVVSCWTQDVKNYSPEFIRGFRNAYSICCHLAAASLGIWLKERWPGGCGGVAYFFESGHPYQNEANELLGNAARAAIPMEEYQYRSHTFAPKADLPPLWAADLLAWEWTKYLDETVVTPKREMRGSLRALIGHGWDYVVGRNPKYRLIHMHGQVFLEFLDGIRQLGIEQLQDMRMGVGGQVFTFDQSALKPDEEPPK